MKKLFFTIAAAASLSAFASRPVIDEKIIQLFHKSFPLAEKISWYEEGNLAGVYFQTAGETCRMWFDKSGDVVRTERYYGADRLPPFLAAQLNKRWKGRTVFSVTEVSTGAGVTYYITLQDARRWYKVTADGSGSLQLDQKLWKA